MFQLFLLDSDGLKLEIFLSECVALDTLSCAQADPLKLSGRVHTLRPTTLLIQEDEGSNPRVGKLLSSYSESAVC